MSKTATANASTTSPGRHVGQVAGWIAAPVLGILVIVGLWALGGMALADSDSLFAFAGLAPAPAFAALGRMLESGEVLTAVIPSLSRIGLGLAIAFLIGAPLGLAIGWWRTAERTVNLPFQFLRMISPLAWMPIAVILFDTWDGAIVFLITAAAIWPIIFSTSAGVKKLDPEWFQVARSIGARGWNVVFTVLLPAVAQDLATGLRLALGVAWIVLVPAEYLGVTSGLGYAINDARDTLEYDRLAALVLVIGAIGFALDMAVGAIARRWRWSA